MGVTNMNYYNHRSMFDYHCLIYNHCEIHEEEVEDDPSKFLLPEVFHFDEKIDYLKKGSDQKLVKFRFQDVVHYGTVKSVILVISISLIAAMTCLLFLFCVMQICSRYNNSHQMSRTGQGMAGNSNIQNVGNRDQPPPNYVSLVLDEDSLPTYKEAEKRSKELQIDFLNQSQVF